MLTVFVISKVDHKVISMERGAWSVELGAWSGREVMNAERRMLNGRADERPSLTQKLKTEHRSTEEPVYRTTVFPPPLHPGFSRRMALAANQEDLAVVVLVRLRLPLLKGSSFWSRL